MSQFPKRCTTCGTVHDAESWAALEYVGTADYSTPGESLWLELKNCKCHSTLAIEVAPACTETSVVRVLGARLAVMR